MPPKTALAKLPPSCARIGIITAMDYARALEYMNGRLRLGIKMGLERMEALLARLGSPHAALRVVHVAGTKGKGSTVAMIAAMLEAAGYKTGQYLSPYVYDLRERIQINNVPIPEADFARWVTTIKPHIDDLEQTEHGPVTEFELKTAVGLCWFAEQRVDVAVLEVGLGGRLDATNVVPPPLVCAITTIGFDHMELLGHTLPEIAREKAGIVKHGSPCVVGVPRGTDAYQAIAAVCRERDAPLLPPARVQECQGGTLTISTDARTVGQIRLRLRGPFQQANAAVAVAVVDAIPASAHLAVSDSAVRAGLAQATLPGRLEKIADAPTVVADGAHNPMAAEALAEALRTEYGACERRVIFVVGFKRNHDPRPFLEALAPLRPALVVATEPGFQPRPLGEVADAARAVGIPHVLTAPTPADAARVALAHARPEDLICVTGSFYTVGDIPPAVWHTLLAERIR